jgi:acyl dehydratase
MSINLDVVGVRRDPQKVSWTSSQSLLYALGVGAGASDAYHELAFTTENSHGAPQQMLPTFAVLLGSMGPEQTDLDERSPMQDAGDFSLAQILHGEQGLTIHRTIAPAGEAMSSSYVSAIYDKGRHAVIESISELRDTGGDLLAEVKSSIVIRDEGGFGGDPGTTLPWALPEEPASHVVRFATRPEQALLYRLSGDRNPLHADPWFARSAGMEQPILHGLCTYGFAGRALLHEVCDGDPDGFGSMSARFASPVLPGDTLTVSLWRTPDAVLFRASVDGRVVLDRGTFRPRR